MINAIVQFREPTSAVDAGLIISAVAALLLGSAVYLLDRDWADTMLLTPFIAYQWATSAAFGDFGGFLPSLLHAYAIPVLIIVALRPWTWTRPWVCLLWFTIALILEWLQSDVGGTWFVAWEKLAGAWPNLKLGSQADDYSWNLGGGHSLTVNADRSIPATTTEARSLMKSAVLGDYSSYEILSPLQAADGQTPGSGGILISGGAGNDRSVW